MVAPAVYQRFPRHPQAVAGYARPSALVFYCQIGSAAPPPRLGVLQAGICYLPFSARGRTPQATAHRPSTSIFRVMWVQPLCGLPKFRQDRLFPPITGRR